MDAEEVEAEIPIALSYHGEKEGYVLVIPLIARLDDAPGILRIKFKKTKT